MSLVVSDRCAAPSSPAAWRTSGRSASAPPADHAGLPLGGEAAGQRREQQFRAPTGGGDEAVAAQFAGEEPGQGGQEGSVGPGWAGWAELAA